MQKKECKESTICNFWEKLKVSKYVKLANKAKFANTGMPAKMVKNSEKAQKEKNAKTANIAKMQRVQNLQGI